MARIDLTRFRLCQNPWCVKGSTREGFTFCPRHKPMRAIPDIAREVAHLWKTPNYAAVPYLAAMLRGDYGADGETSIVLYFLSNARTWRGPDAKRLKAELKATVR